MFSLLHKRFCLCIHAQQLFCRGLFWGNKTWPSLVSSRSHHTHGSIHISPVRGSHKQWLRLVRPSGQCPCCWWFGICFDFTIKYGKNHDWFFMVFHGSRSVFHVFFYSDLELDTIKTGWSFGVLIMVRDGACVRLLGSGKSLNWSDKGWMHTLYTSTLPNLETNSARKMWPFHVKRELTCKNFSLSSPKSMPHWLTTPRVPSKIILRFLSNDSTMVLPR